MTANLQYNPYTTQVGTGLFTTRGTASGYVQGTAFPDPAVINWLRQGVLADDETIPMWGGVAVYQDVAPQGGGSYPSFNRPRALGGKMGRATAVTGGSKPINGFCVFDQNYSAVNSPESPVPLVGSGQGMMMYPLGSRARIAVACDPSLTSLANTPITSQVAWDFVNQLLVPYTGAVSISSGTYDSVTGKVTLTMASAVNLSPGDSVTISSATGTGSFASINGTYTTIAGTTGSTVVYTIAPSLTLTITGGSLTTGSALPVTVLDVAANNNVTVNYNSGTNLATWNFDAAAALIQI